MPRGTKRAAAAIARERMKTPKKGKKETAADGIAEAHEQWKGIEGSVCHIDIPVKCNVGPMT